MISKSYCCPAALPRVSKRLWRQAAPFFWPLCLLFAAPRAILADAPAWMHAAAAAPIPAHDEKTDAIAVYSEDIMIVLSDSKVKSIERRAYRILRPAGRDYGFAYAEFDSDRKITAMRGWCIPAQGKDYEVKDKEAVDVSLSGIEYSELVTDVKDRLLRIPAAEPGNVVGYEIEVESRPYILQDWWHFQGRVPVKEAKYSLQLPAGWEYKAVWINHSEVQPSSSGPNQWQWTITDVPSIRPEEEMPPWRGVAGQMIVSFFPSGQSVKKGFDNWAEMAHWESNLAQGRRDPSQELKQKVVEITASAPNTLDKMKAIAEYVQKNVRYVAIELGIGGFQPHAASAIYSHHYGDCKDKATLTSAMLKEIGVDSYYLDINTERGAVSPSMPPHMYWFNHEILAIRLPDNVGDTSLAAIYTHPKLGKILIFDPTDEITPFGDLRGELQENYGLLVLEEGGELIQVPKLSPLLNGHRRMAKLALSPSGTLSGEIVEIHTGDSATRQRYTMRAATKDTDRIKPIESLLSHSLGTFKITKATVTNLSAYDQPIQYNYSFTADQYAKSAGDLLLVRPTVVGSWYSDILEKKEPRLYPVEFEGPMRNVDSFEIKLPEGYSVDDLPPPVDAEYFFGSYHSKCEVKNGALHFVRTMEIKELSVPVDKLSDLKTFYRIVGSDERSTAVLKPKTT